MFDHVTIRVSDRHASEAIYRAALGELGLDVIYVDEWFVEWGELSLKASDERPATTGLHIGFVAPSRAHVDAFWHAGRAPRRRCAGRATRLQARLLRRVPSRSREIEGRSNAAPYPNFYPVNGGIIVGIPEDEIAFRLLGELFPGREVVGVPTDVQAYGGGGIGCITQQVPAGTPLT